MAVKSVTPASKEKPFNDNQILELMKFYGFMNYVTLDQTCLFVYEIDATSDV